MKFSRLFVLGALVMGIALGGCAKSEVFTVAENGVLKADIVVPAEPSGVERYAADELKYHLDKALGSDAEIVTEDKFERTRFPRHFFIGRTTAATAKSLPGRGLTLDERFLRTSGDRLYLLGNDT